MINPITFHVPTVTSTNDVVRDLLPTYPYVLVTAQEQTRGRGRHGRVWEGEKDANLYASIGIRHGDTVTAEEIAMMMAKGALTVLDVCRRIAPLANFRLKYPNDVQAHSTGGTWAKISGILVENDYLGSTCTQSVIGIGLNVLQTTFPKTIAQPCTSLKLLNVETDVLQVVEALQDSLKRYVRKSWMELHQEWEMELIRACGTLAVVGDNGEWVITRLLHDGRLMIRNNDTLTERTISDGDTLRYTN